MLDFKKNKIPGPGGILNLYCNLQKVPKLSGLISKKFYFILRLDKYWHCDDIFCFTSGPSTLKRLQPSHYPRVANQRQDWCTPWSRRGGWWEWRWATKWRKSWCNGRSAAEHIEGEPVGWEPLGGEPHEGEHLVQENQLEKNPLEEPLKPEDDDQTEAMKVVAGIKVASTPGELAVFVPGSICVSRCLLINFVTASQLGKQTHLLDEHGHRMKKYKPSTGSTVAGPIWN